MTCSRCHEPMMDAECVDPDETGLMGMKGWRCEGCGDDHTPRHRHHCSLRQDLFQVSMIAPDGDEDGVPLGWEAYTGQPI